MVVELVGGPADGATFTDSSELPAYMVVSSGEDAPVYRASCCTTCAARKERMKYYFLGYERNITGISSNI